MGEEMNIPEKQAKIMKILEGVSPRLGMKAGRIATELYGPPSGNRKLRDGHEVNGSIAELKKSSLIENARGNPTNPMKWTLTDKGRNLLEEMEGQEG